jgi:hypothetical protein
VSQKCAFRGLRGHVDLRLRRGISRRAEEEEPHRPLLICYAAKVYVQLVVVNLYIIQEPSKSTLVTPNKHS